MDLKSRQARTKCFIIKIKTLYKSITDQKLYLHLLIQYASLKGHSNRLHWQREMDNIQTHLYQVINAKKTMGGWGGGGSTHEICPEN